MLISTSIKGSVIDSEVYDKVIIIILCTGAELLSLHHQFLQTKERSGDRVSSVKIHFRNIFTKFGREFSVKWFLKKRTPIKYRVFHDFRA